MNIFAKFINFIPSSIKLKLYKSRFGSILFLLRDLFFYTASIFGRKVVVNTKNGKFFLDLTTYPHFETITGNYELIMQQAFIDNLRKGNIVYDIGANIGFHSFSCANIIGSSGIVYSFEPNRFNIKKLKLNSEVNPNLNIKILEYAISNYDGFSNFEINKGSEEGYLNNDGDIQVPVRKIDTLVRNNEILPPNLIKLDIEGSEKNALLGAINTIIKHKPIILCDYHDERTFPSLNELLEPLGYTLNKKEIIIANAT